MFWNYWTLEVQKNALIMSLEKSAKKQKFN